jgi:hypothetical protein
MKPFDGAKIFNGIKNKNKGQGGLGGRNKGGGVN